MVNCPRLLKSQVEDPNSLRPLSDVHDSQVGSLSSDLIFGRDQEERKENIRRVNDPEGETRREGTETQTRKSRFFTLAQY